MADTSITKREESLRVFNQAAFEKVPELIPGAQFTKVPVSKHMVQLERPDAVNRAITRFLGVGTVSWREGREREPVLRDDLLERRIVEDAEDHGTRR